MLIDRNDVPDERRHGAGGAPRGFEYLLWCYQNAWSESPKERAARGMECLLPVESMVLRADIRVLDRMRKEYG
jgi:hypothetical protein